MGESPSDQKWEKRASRLLRSRLALAGVSQEELATRLSSRRGELITAQSVRSRLSRGTFGAAFMLEVLEVLNCEKLDLTDV